MQNPAVAGDSSVSIHAFRGEGDTLRSTGRTPLRLFQSTPSGGKATVWPSVSAAEVVFQSTPSGGKATGWGYLIQHLTSVSIHAFRGEGDWTRRSKRSFDVCFNPRLPGGRRRVTEDMMDIVKRFNPRLPGGRRPLARKCFIIPIKFQSTPSGGKATRQVIRMSRVDDVSIHAFRGEGDLKAGSRRSASASFNPRLPGGRRRAVSAGWIAVTMFQSTPSGGKATW